jgi:hypothetical protein
VKVPVTIAALERSQKNTDVKQIRRRSQAVFGVRDDSRNVVITKKFSWLFLLSPRNHEAYGAPDHGSYHEPRSVCYSICIIERRRVDMRLWTKDDTDRVLRRGLNEFEHRLPVFLYLLSSEIDVDC